MYILLIACIYINCMYIYQLKGKLLTRKYSLLNNFIKESKILLRFPSKNFYIKNKKPQPINNGFTLEVQSEK